MGKRMFFVSLLILSIAMGFQFYKAKPKKLPSRSKSPTVAINLDDLEVKKPDNASASLPASQADIIEKADDKTGTNASPTASITTEENSPVQRSHEIITASGSNNLQADPIIYAFANLKRNPFESPPFARLIAEAQASAAAVLAADPIKANKSKPTEILNVPFGGTIETQNALLAVIDKRLYKVGDQFQGKTIRKIEKTHVTLDDANKIYLLPKTGVQIKLSGESITITDEFLKKTSQ